VNPPATAGGVSRLGLGCATFGREADRETSLTLLDYAADRGVTYYDTAAAYSNGVSEQIVGDWLQTRSPTATAVTVGTKILPPYTPEALRVSIEQSRQRLRVGCIPWLWLHRWDETLRPAATLAALEELRLAGTFAQLGVSNFSREQLAGLLARQHRLALAPVRALQNVNNFAVRGFDAELAELCRHENIEMISYSPLGAGFLSGKHAQGVVPGSRFAVAPGHQDIYFNDQNHARLQELQQRAKETGISDVQFALRWAIGQRAITRVLIGARKVEHIEAALLAAGAAAIY
jgi:aryl-alcohol dehydrogenase-like predicted oxidoreductase